MFCLPLQHTTRLFQNSNMWDHSEHLPKSYSINLATKHVIKFSPLSNLSTIILQCITINSSSFSTTGHVLEVCGVAMATVLLKGVGKGSDAKGWIFIQLSCEKVS